MNFFKSILSDEPNPNSAPESEDADPQIAQSKPSSSSSPSSRAAGDGAWSFSGLVKTLATQSESVIEIYRRDLNEFKSGLQKETATFRDIASRAVKELPAEIDGVLKSTAEIISHGTDSLLAPPPPDHGPDSDPANSRKYSRFEAQLRAIEGDVNTYCEEPEDLEDFEKWKLGFVLDEKKDENETIKGIYRKIVPNLVDDETFWFRYFYKVHKLKQQEDARAKLVKRAISIDMDEELSWDVDDDEEDNDETKELTKKSEIHEAKEIDTSESSKIDEIPKVIDEEKENNTTESSKIDEIPKVIDEKMDNNSESIKIDEISQVVDENMDNNHNNNPKSTIETPKKEQVVNEKGDKDGDVAIIEDEEDDMGWDEIEDVESGDEKKMGTPNRDDLRKRLSVAEEDEEDLSWDIEDDDDEEHVAKPGSK